MSFLASLYPPCSFTIPQQNLLSIRHRIAARTATAASPIRTAPVITKAERAIVFEGKKHFLLFYVGK